MNERILQASNEQDRKLLSAKSQPVSIKNTGILPISKADLETVKRLQNAFKELPSALGIAANQIGVLKQIFILQVNDNTGGSLIFMNPQIKRRAGGDKQSVETCLSHPGRPFRVNRAKIVEVTYVDYLTGTRCLEIFKGRESIIIQHMMDHINGILI